MNKILTLCLLFFVFQVHAQYLESGAPLPGVVVAHVPKSSGSYLGTPSVVILANGDYLASFDFFGPQCSSDKVHVYRSADKGKTWHFFDGAGGYFLGRIICCGYGCVCTGRTWIRPQSIDQKVY